MSVAFETAAGVFAVVGVVDVLVRTGHELYNFLSEIVDAPDDVVRLQESIRVTIALSQASKKCLEGLKARIASAAPSNAVLTLDSALRALNRELQSLRGSTAKFKGTKTWSRVKYVLNKARIDKGIQHLEQAKASLSSALTLVCRELSAIGHTSIEGLVRRCLREVGLRTDDLSQTFLAALDVHHQSIGARIDTHLDNHHNEIIALHHSQQNSIVSALSSHHWEQVSGNTDNHQQIMSKLASDSYQVQARQDHLTRLSTRNFHQGTSIARKLTSANRISIAQHGQTTALINTLTSDIQQLKMSLNRGPVRVSQSNRDVLFFGEHSDMIMAYLLPLQNDLEHAIDALMENYGREISVGHAHWLQEEFDHLVDSAAQEQAGRYASSTATSLDRWSYPLDILGSLKEGSTRKRKRRAVQYPEAQPTKRVRQLIPRASKKPSNRTWSMNTPSGDFRVSIPRSRSEKCSAESTDEVGFSCTITQNRSIFAINARFLRVLAPTEQPRIYAQLSVFTRVEHLDDVYRRLFEDGTIEAIDFAYRNGTISPFHVNEDGTNYYFENAIRKIRPDALDYLASQGIRTGLLSYGLDTSNSQRFLRSFLLYSERHMKHNPKMRVLVDHISDEVTYSSSIFADVALTLLIQAHGRRDWGISWTLFHACLQMLQKEGHDFAHFDWLDSCRIPQDPPWERERPVQLLQAIIAGGADIDGKYTGNRNAISYFMLLRLARLENESTGVSDLADVEFLSALIEIGVDIHCICSWGNTPSIEARLNHCWQEWCSALARQNKTVADVVDTEAHSWLLKDNWRERWDDRTGVDIAGIFKERRSDGYYYTDSEYSDDGSEYDLDDLDDPEIEWPDIHLSADPPEGCTLTYIQRSSFLSSAEAIEC